MFSESMHHVRQSAALCVNVAPWGTRCSMNSNAGVINGIGITHDISVARHHLADMTMSPNKNCTPDCDVQLMSVRMNGVCSAFNGTGSKALDEPAHGEEEHDHQWD